MSLYQSELMCKQNVSVNAPPHTGTRIIGSTDSKDVSVAQRVKEFASELITVSAGKLFCFVC